MTHTLFSLCAYTYKSRPLRYSHLFFFTHMLFTLTLCVLCVLNLKFLSANETESLKTAIQKALGTPFTYAQLSYNAPHGDAWTYFKDKAEADNATVLTFGTSYEAASGFIYAPDEGVVFLVFKGTSNKDNALTNLDGHWTYDPDARIRVHHGFRKHYKAFRDQMLSQLQSIANKRGIPLSQLPLHVVGHSLGAGVAHIAAFSLKVLYQANIQHVTTFAAPMAFDRKSGEMYDAQLKHVTNTFVHELDPVTHVGGTSPFEVGARLAQQHKLADLLNTRTHVGRLIPLPTPSLKEIHRLIGYREAMNKALDDPDYETNAHTLILPKKDKSEGRNLSDTAIYNLHKGVSTAKNFLGEKFGFRKPKKN